MKAFLIFMAIVFAVATVFLYDASVKKLDRDTAKVLGTNSVANVQATVFCAATAIMSVINAVGAMIISALRDKNRSSSGNNEDSFFDEAAAPEKKEPTSFSQTDLKALSNKLYSGKR